MKKFLFASLLGILAVVIFTFPSIFHISDRIIGDGGDNYQFLAFQNLAWREFESGQFPFGWTNYWRYPVGFNFGISYDSSLLLTLGIVLYPIVSNPVVVYNLSVLLFLLFNYISSYIFFRYVTKSTFLGILGGLIYGFSFYSLARMGGHPNLIFTGFVPLLAYSLYRIYKTQGDFISFVVLTIASILVYMSSLQYLLLVSGALLITTPIFIVFYPTVFKEFVNILWQKKKLVLVSFIIIGSIFFFFHGQRLEMIVSKKLILPTPEIVSVPLDNYFLPNIYSKTLSAIAANNTREWIEYVVFLGFAEFILFLVFLVSSVLPGRLRGFIAFLVLILFILSTGMVVYSLVFFTLPFRGIIEPGRFYVVFYFLITLGILLSLPKRLLFLLIIFAIIFLERLPNNFYSSPTLYDRDLVKSVASIKSEAVLDVPIFTEWWNGNRYDLYSVYYDKPIVNGYIHWSGNDASTKSFLEKLQGFSCDSSRASGFDVSKVRPLLLSTNIHTIVFHKDISIPHAECDMAISYFEQFAKSEKSHLVKRFENKEKNVYELVD
ncbi:hypothetical protein HYW54_05420 [Candidatus Gottesmanbacteria bacterium]|nr:hypothetical protein [Candidatus Gottesmanbacteria bacterium]